MEYHRVGIPGIPGITFSILDNLLIKIDEEIKLYLF